MRITGGRARGIPLIAPRGNETRPATDQLREALFSSLGSQVQGAHVADFFAGTGAYGLEALSRGAAAGRFIESSRDALTCLRRNLQAVEKSIGHSFPDWQVLPHRVEQLPRSDAPLVDIAFVDPPYAIIHDQLPGMVISHIGPVIQADGCLCVEMPGNLELELTGWIPNRRIGKAGRDKPSVVIYFREGTLPS